jgi:hypothetical protein
MGLEGPSREIKVEPMRRTEPAREPARAPEREPAREPVAPEREKEKVS